MNIDFLETPTYTLYLSSNDKVSGSNNNCTFNVNWDSFLSRDYDRYKVRYSFLTSGGYYKDGVTNSTFANCKIVANFNGRSLSYSTETGGPTTILGFAFRDLQSTTTSSNFFNAYLEEFPAKTISRPTQDTLSISIYNAGKQNNLQNQLLVDTNSAGNALDTDMTSWVMVLEFIPIDRNLKQQTK